MISLNKVKTFQDLVRKLLVKDPKKRLTARQALQHPWVAGKAAKTNHMEETQRKLKELQARKKLKVCRQTYYNVLIVYSHCNCIFTL